MFQEQLEKVQSEETLSNKYFVIRYNCWKFDYYEEPLVAIVASMLTVIEEKTKLFPEGEKKREILGVLKAISITLLSLGNTVLREKTGVDIQQAYATILDERKEEIGNYEKKHNYDTFFYFNKVMRKLAEVIKSLTKDYTIVFLVDELDRCLPEYSIKVLERLHHLTEEESNIITVISIDKNQLLSSVDQIFGFKNPEKYLDKFINFEVKLDCGTVSNTLCQKYADYIALFDRELFLFDEPVEECLQALFKNIDIRTQEQLMKKAMLAHTLLYSDKKDYSFMCMEVLLVIMICVYQDNSCFSDSPVDLTSFKNVFVSKGKSLRPVFDDFFKKKFENISFSVDIINNNIYRLPKKPNLYAAILFTWYWMHPPANNIIFQHVKKDAYDGISENHIELKKYAEIIKMIS